jgi:hypothetical protein
MAVRSQILFQSGEQPGGWSEVYYINVGTVDQAVVALDAIAAVRGQLLSSDNSIIGYRVGLPLAPPGPGFIRSQRTAYLATRNIPGSNPNAGITSDLIWSGVMLRLNDATKTVFKNQIYRGVPDNFWGAGGDKIARAFIVPQFLNKWVQVLQANGVYINHKLRGAGGFVATPITNVEYVRMVHRNTGRVFGGLRGRR